MGYYVINNLIKERINMIKQLQEVSLKSLDMINKNAENLNKLAEFLKDMQDNQNAMAKKILDLDTEIASLQKRLEVYERPQN